MHNNHQRPPRFTRHWQIVLTLLLILVLLVVGLPGCASTLSSTQPVQITPLTLSPGTRTPGQPTTGDWPMYHADAARSGFVANMADPGHLTSHWRQTLDGAVYAEPLVVGGKVIAATENDTLYALDAGSGQIQWHTSVGKPVPQADLPCGDIDPLGITGTPVYDPQTGLVFAVAEIEGPAHLLVGVEVKTGQVKVRRLVDPPDSIPRNQQQRPALALEDGKVYVAFGGLDGDCAQYHGYLVASRTDGTGSLLTYQTPSPREGAIWATSGPVIDAHGNLYVTVGNGAITQGTWDHTDSVLRLSPTLQLEDAFAPQSWTSDNASDLDLGSMGPVLLPDSLLFVQGKASQGYLLHSNHLGDIGGQIQTLSPCDGGAFGGAAVSGLLAFIPCTNGLREIQLGAGPRIIPSWQASQVSGSPVIGGHTVYSLDAGSGTLYALDMATGAMRASISVGSLNRFATPTLSQNSVFVGTLTGLVAVHVN